MRKVGVTEEKTRRFHGRCARSPKSSTTRDTTFIRRGSITYLCESKLKDKFTVRSLRKGLMRYTLKSRCEGVVRDRVRTINKEGL